MFVEQAANDALGLANESHAPARHKMRLCYCDESGTGKEPIAVMVGIVVDAHRMHVTKKHWQELLGELSNIAGREIAELHTTNFYSGNGIWRSMTGPQRSEVIDAIFEWLCERKHSVVYSSILKTEYEKNFGYQKVKDELNTHWRFMGFHLALAMQKYCQRELKNKGHTIFIFDNEERERMRFTDIIRNPPVWSDVYYRREKKQDALDQVIDVPYFGDSQEVSLIQLADVAAFFLRRYAEIKEGLVPAEYKDEEEKVTKWVQLFASRSIGSSFIYLKQGRGKVEEMFYENAPASIRSL